MPKWRSSCKNLPCCQGSSTETVEQRRVWSHPERRASRANLRFRARPQHPQWVFIKPLFLQCFPGEVCITPRPSWTMKPVVQKHAGVITAIPDPQPGGWCLPFSTAGSDEGRGSPAGHLSWDETATPATAPASLSPASGVSLFFIILGCHRGAWYPGRHWEAMGNEQYRGMLSWSPAEGRRACDQASGLAHQTQTCSNISPARRGEVQASFYLEWATRDQCPGPCCTPPSTGPFLRSGPLVPLLPLHLCMSCGLGLTPCRLHG